MVAFKDAFPAFSTVPDATVDYWRDRADLIVTPSWPDAEHAAHLLTAHYLASNGYGAGLESETVGMAGFTTIKSGALSLTRDGTAASATGYASTSYGRQFKALLRAVRGGPLVTGSAGPIGYDDHWGWPHGLA